MPFLATKSFAGLTYTQFLGAFNDNLFKQVILLLAARLLFEGEDKQGLAFIVFSAPFVLFSGIAGDISEKFSKRSVIVAMKAIEIALMVAGTFALVGKDWTWLLVLLFLMGAQSAFFGPSKYGVIPELVPGHRLLWANGIISMTTFLAILGGETLAGPILDHLIDALWIPGIVCVALSILGLVTALRIERLPAQSPTARLPWSPFGSMGQTLRMIRADKTLFAIVLVNSVFWFNGGVLNQVVNALARPELLDLAKDENWKLSVMKVVLAVFVMAGCLAAPRIGRRFTSAQMTFVGATGVALSQSALVFVGTVFQGDSSAYLVANVALAVSGFAAAQFVVPLAAYIQYAPREGSKGKVLATNNFCTFVGIFLAGGFYLALTSIALSPTIIALLSGFILLGSVWVARASVAKLLVPVR